jgi:Tryptophan halogenase
VRELKPISDVVIVGGGTAGWMTAAYLWKAFGHRVRITVLEAPAIAKIGVGEATVPNLQKVLFDFLGIPEYEWMTKCNAAFKTAVKFVNWRKKAPGETENHFYHPFGILPSVDGIPLPQYWTHLTGGKGEQVDYACFREPPLMDAKLAPKMRDGKKAVPHAWHFDAHLVADFLREWSTTRGVVHIRDEVQHVPLNDRGEIASLECKSGASIKADLFVDCSGFRGLLINQALKEPFIDMSDHLLCDSAVAAAVPNDDARVGVDPYTSAIAMNAGWTWKIPMLTRFGSGYVYSSKFASVDDAVRDYCKLWNLDESKVNMNKIRFRTGRNVRAWVKNCVSIGLSSCFLEPLESTGIYFITAAIYQLAKHFPAHGYHEGLVESFNREIEYMFDDSRDFLQAHYFTTTRDDSPFWLACKNDLHLSDNMKEKIARYKAGLPINPPMSSEDDYYSSFDVEFRNFWTNGSYYAVFAGMGFVPDTPYPMLAYKEESVAKAVKVFQDIKRAQADLVSNLPTNYEFLSQVHAGERSAERSVAVAMANTREAIGSAE